MPYGKAVPLADAAQDIREINQMFSNQVGHLTLALVTSPDPDHARGQDQAAMFLEQRWPDDNVGHIRLVLNRHEHDTLGRPWFLSHQDKACHRHPAAVSGLPQVCAAANVSGRELSP